MHQQDLPESVIRTLNAIPSARSGEVEFRRLLEKLPAGAYTCDPQGLITYFNQHAVNLWGRQPKLNDPSDRWCGSFKLFGTDSAAIGHDDCWMARALKQNREFNGHEIIIQRPSGERVTVLAYANPIHDELGQLIGAVNVLVDISERKRAEDALRQADRSKDEFLATLAHELRNPLAPLRNAVQIMRLQGSHTPQSQWAMDVIERQMQQMTRLIDDLLDVSRITRNKLELRQDRVELASVVKVAVETSRPVIESFAHELTVTMPEEPIHVHADTTRLAQAISNLLNNAARYTEQSGQIWLTAQRDGHEVVLSVKDNGIGISADLLPRVFDMFTQAERPMDRAQGGLGIGLTLVKRLVELHGGTVAAHSDGPGRGSEFVVRLPVMADDDHARRDPTDDHAVPSKSSLRILIADDNRDSANSLATLLRMTGNDVRTAYDGADAVVAAEEFRPDVILLDIGMPRLDGNDAAQRIRAESWGKCIVLIAVTGWGQDADKQRSKDAGFDHHLVKPIDPRALLKLLASLHRTSADA